MLAFTSVYFSESGLFNVLRAIQIRFLLSLPPSVPICAKGLAVIAAIARDALCRRFHSFESHCMRGSAFPQGIVEKSEGRRDPFV
jgi:hypothetical protein